MKTIKIPHLFDFEVNVCDLKDVRGIEDQMPKGKGAGFTMETDKGAAVAFLEYKANIKKLSFAPVVAHEIVHVIQIICDRYKFKIENEQEHMAYIMSYLMQQIMELPSPIPTSTSPDSAVS